MRNWISKGYLTHGRLARPLNSPPDALRAIWAWPQFNPGADIARSRAKDRWKKARRVVSLAAQHARTLKADESFAAFNRALQQRYARSSFGFDALLLRHAPAPVPSPSPCRHAASSSRHAAK